MRVLRNSEEKFEKRADSFRGNEVSDRFPKSKDDINKYWRFYGGFMAVYPTFSGATPPKSEYSYQGRSQLFAKGGALCRATSGGMTFYNWIGCRGGENSRKTHM